MTAKLLTDAARQKKNADISASLKKTREKRKTQECKTFDLKISRLSLAQREILEGIFREAKNLRNHIIASGIKDYKIGKTVEVRLPNKTFETRTLKHLGSQMKQSVLTEVERNLKALSALKKNGHTVGALRPTSDEQRSIELKQYGTTYEIKGTRARIQKVGSVRIRGAEQLDGWDLASAKLLKLADGYHLRVSAFRAPELENFQPGTAVGLDMGLKTHFTFSDGTEFNAAFEEPEYLKRLQRKLARQQKGSNGYRKTQTKLQRAHLDLTRRKDDAANKLVHSLLKNELVVIQDEQLAQWKRRDGFVRGGRAIQHGIFGRVKMKLAANPRVIMLSKWIATTKTCVCGKTNEMPVTVRIYSCVCGYTAPRDLHAAQNMLRLATEIYSGQELSAELVESIKTWVSSDYLSGTVKLETADHKKRRPLQKLVT
jgi:putative transposase